MKAIADRGWYLANRMLLDHPDLKKKEILNTPSPNNLLANNGYNAINLDNEVASKVMTKIVSEFMKRNGVKKRMENLKKGDLIKKRFESSRALTSGTLVSHGMHNLNDTRIINHIKFRKEEKLRKARNRTARNKVNLERRINKVQAIRKEKGNHFSEYSNEELKAYIQYKKRKGDPGMPKFTGETQKKALLEMSQDYSGRKSPIPPILNPQDIMKAEDDSYHSDSSMELEHNDPETYVEVSQDCTQESTQDYFSSTAETGTI